LKNISNPDNKEIDLNRKEWHKEGDENEKPHLLLLYKAAKERAEEKATKN